MTAAWKRDSSDWPFGRLMERRQADDGAWFEFCSGRWMPVAGEIPELSAEEVFDLGVAAREREARAEWRELHD